MNNRIYFVLNGLLNGEEGVYAIPAGGGEVPPQEDGWYFFVFDGDTDGEGPFDSRDEAQREMIASDKRIADELSRED